MNKENIIYKDSTKTIEERVADLLSKMTLDEKVAQLGCYSNTQLLKEDQIDFGYMKLVVPDGLGQMVMMSNGPLTLEQQAKRLAEVQRYFVEETRLGIPVIPHIEALSGVMIGGMTNFSAGIAQAATWHPEKIQAMTEIIRDEMLAMGYRQALSPVLDVARDMRWGRIGETYGEDPYLVSAIGTGFIRGLQSDDLMNGVVATGKHFLGYANSERGFNMASENITDRKLYEIYGRPFETAIHEAGLYSIMNSYGERDGVPLVASKAVFTDMLRDTMGFKGCVVSDYTSVERLIEPYHVAEDMKDAGIQCLKAGLDVEFPIVAAYNQDMVKAVNTGELDVFYIERAVKRVLDTKFRLGLFENPYPDFGKIGNVMSEEAVQISQEVAQESFVLLKNDEALLPLSPKTKRIAIIGPHGDSYRAMFGGYTSVGQLDMMIQCGKGNNKALMEGIEDMLPDSTELFTMLANLDIEQVIPHQYPGIKTIKSAVEAVVAEGVEVHYTYGCGVKSTSKKDFDEAVEMAADSDVVIMTMGGRYGWGAHCTSGEGTDASYIGFSGVQEELIKAVYRANKELVLVQMGAKPIASEWVSEHIPAILQVWVPGQQGAQAIADTLFGICNPSGKLPLTVARNAAQMPVYYNPPRGTGDRREGFSDYVNEASSPLYCFGHGLSYTTFEYGDIVLSDSKVDSSDKISLSVEVSNIGDYDGAETVQVYFEDKKASVARPKKELVAFKKLALASGETAKVQFTVNMNQLGFYDRDMVFAVEPGLVGVQVGASSDDIRCESAFEIVGEKLDVLKKRSYLAKSTVIRKEGSYESE